MEAQSAEALSRWLLPCVCVHWSSLLCSVSTTTEEKRNSDLMGLVWALKDKYAPCCSQALGSYQPEVCGNSKLAESRHGSSPITHMARSNYIFFKFILIYCVCVCVPVSVCMHAIVWMEARGHLRGVVSITCTLGIKHKPAHLVASACTLLRHLSCPQ